MAITFTGKDSGALIGLTDQYRLTYDVQTYFGIVEPDADVVERQVYANLPKVGLIPRSLPLATPDAVVITVRVEPGDVFRNQTVAKLAAAADFSNIDFRLGADFALGTDVDLTDVAFLGITPAKATDTTTPGTQPAPGDSIAQQQAAAKAKEKDPIQQFLQALTTIAVIAGIGLVAYIIFKFKD